MKIFLKGKNDKYLLLKRSKVLYPNIRNFWDIPGGRIIPGTALVKNIHREVFEETKLAVIGKPQLISAQDIIRPGEKHIVRLTFVSRARGKVSLNEEHTDFKWVTPVEMSRVKKLDEFTRVTLRKNFEKFL